MRVVLTFLGHNFPKSKLNTFVIHVTIYRSLGGRYQVNFQKENKP